ncbi:MAG: hypothetical protein ACI4XR_00390 [Bacilli bacterium]
MNINKIVIYITIISCFLIISIPTFYKIIKTNEEKLYIVNEKKVTESAYKCYYEGKCKGSTITLKELYDNGYLVDNIVDPKTKEIYSENSYVILYSDKKVFYPI